MFSGEREKLLATAIPNRRSSSRHSISTHGFTLARLPYYYSLGFLFLCYRFSHWSNEIRIIITWVGFKRTLVLDFLDEFFQIWNKLPLKLKTSVVGTDEDFHDLFFLYFP